LEPEVKEEDGIEGDDDVFSNVRDDSNKREVKKVTRKVVRRRHPRDKDDGDEKPEEKEDLPVRQSR